MLERNSGFVAIEALVGLFISITGCLILVMSFHNMNDFLSRQQDELNAHLAFIELQTTEQPSLRIDNNRYQLIVNNQQYFVENINKGTKFAIEKK